MSELSTRVRLRREELGLSQEQLAQRMGYRSKSSITKLEKGVNDIPQAKLEELAAALETTPAYLLGLDVLCPPPGFEPLPAMAMVPLVGSIACGTPITAEQNIEQYIGVPAAWHADFALTCHGDSMAPTICDGDIVCIRCQPEVEQGEIAAVQRRRLPAHGLHRSPAERDPHRGPGRGLLPRFITYHIRRVCHVLFQKETACRLRPGRAAARFAVQHLHRGAGGRFCASGRPF